MKKLLMLIGLGLFVGCNGTKEIKIPQGGVINMKIKNLETLLESKELILPEGKMKDRDHVWYLEDGTKVEFSRCLDNSDDSIEHIYSSKYPFIQFYKSYTCKHNQLYVLSQNIRGIRLGILKVYNEQGKLTKNIDYRERTGYKNILAWAEEKGYLDLKRVKVLEGRDFDLSYEEITSDYVDMLHKKYLRLYKDEKLVKKLLTHKALWTYTTLYMNEYRNFVFSETGEFLYDAGKKPIVTFASGEEIE